MPLETKYIIEGTSVQSVYEIEEGVFVYTSTVFKSKSELYNSRKDALYYNFLKQIQAGKPVSNFRSSPYFKEYIKRAKKENPEDII